MYIYPYGISYIQDKQTTNPMATMLPRGKYEKKIKLTIYDKKSFSKPCCISFRLCNSKSTRKVELFPAIGLCK